MCGIVGYIGKRDATPVLVEGLHRLEYRGYDSAGLAVVHRGRLQVTKTAGRVQDLRDKLDAKQTKATIGIGHTRWATHGEPNDTNAHPHTDAQHRIAVVHNGIIENAEALRAQLTADGVKFVTDTDTEALAHMIAAELAARTRTPTLEEAVIATLRSVEGTYGLVVLDTRHPDQLVVARNGSPIVLGLGESEMFVASDVAALVRYTRQVIYLEDGEVATIKATDYHTTTLDRRSADNSIKTPTTVDADADDYELGAVQRLHAQGDPRAAGRHPPRGHGPPRRAVRHREARRRQPGRPRAAQHQAGQVPRLRLRLLRGADGRDPRRGARAHPRRRRAGQRVPLPQPGRGPGHAVRRRLAVRRDERHADGRAGAQAQGRPGHGRRQRRRQRHRARVRPRHLPARGPGGRGRVHQGADQHGGQLRAARAAARPGARPVRRQRRAHRRRPAQPARPRWTTILNAEEEIAAIAHRFAEADHMFFIGRVRGWPVAREGAQKLKEISYVHAEAYQAGELKHGPLALIQPEMPSVVIIPSDDLIAKNISTIEQIKARGGPVIALTSADIPDGLADATIRVPRAEPELEPILFNIPLQILAYHAAAKLGRDIDKPRNLAKSVTVE